LGKNPRILKSGETPAVEYQRLWDCISAGQVWHGEFHNRRKDGTLYWERASISPIRNVSGVISHFIAVKEDMTEQKLTQSKLLRAQRVESIGSLASGIAHDLNNILAPILLCAPMLQMEESPGIRKELAQTIESSAQRAVGIVKQLLSFARGKEGQKQPLQLRHLVRDMAKLARETFPRSIQIEECCATDLWPVQADATQLHQVILNLCVNARDAMLDEGGRLTLRAANVTLDEHFVAMHSEASPGPHVRLQVEDTGGGIPENIQEHIFESFFTTKGEDQGTGLGLTTVQGIVKDHRGFITFTSSVGKGTTFEVHLPAAPEADFNPVEAIVANTSLRGQGELILVVDDEQAICDATRRTLEHHGYRVVVAHNGIQGLAEFSAHQNEIRAVVTDFMMPLMDGVTLCRALRALSPSLNLVISSGGLFGKAGTEAQRAFEETGIRHVLHKPHNADLLLRALSEVFQATAPVSTREST
jgi:signal transduction histidine kinase/CheY-like chemotaxis protein